MQFGWVNFDNYKKLPCIKYFDIKCIVIASKLTIRRDLCKRTTGGASVPALVLTASSIKRYRRRGASAIFSAFVQWDLLCREKNTKSASSGQVLFRLTAVLATRQTSTNASCVNVQYWTKKTQPNIKCYLISFAQNLVMKFSVTWKFLMHLMPIIKNCIEILCNINFAENIWSQKLASTFRLQAGWHKVREPGNRVPR